VKNFAAAIAITVAFYLLWNQFGAAKTVTDVIDGDTFKIGGRPVRLIGINSPELGEPCSYEAKDELTKLVLGKEVRLESDAGNKDIYGRLLRYAYVQGTFVNEEMVRLGMAKIEEIAPNVKYSDRLSEAEAKARKSKRCVWK
jgi:micrococcal nuclease